MVCPFILSEGLPHVPPKLVKKIQKGDYVDMAELLRDNMELGRRQSLEAEPGGGSRRWSSAISQGGSRPTQLDRVLRDVRQCGSPKAPP